jgi:hypothetical protein
MAEEKALMLALGKLAKHHDEEDAVDIWQDIIDEDDELWRKATRGRVDEPALYRDMAALDAQHALDAQPNPPSPPYEPFVHSDDDTDVGVVGSVAPAPRQSALMHGIADKVVHVRGRSQQLPALNSERRKRASRPVTSANLHLINEWDAAYEQNLIRKRLMSAYEPARPPRSFEVRLLVLSLS